MTQQQSSPATEPIINSRNSSPYVAWLNQEVVWIITPEEKQAFLRLSNDQERDAFIEQFWNRRNPDPGSPENKFRDEHYRRIAYADAHFAVAAQPGWETDRGHVYIVYGPPTRLTRIPRQQIARRGRLRSGTTSQSASRSPPCAVRMVPGALRRPQSGTMLTSDLPMSAVAANIVRSPWPMTGTTTEPRDAPSASGGAVLGLQVLTNTENANLEDWVMRWHQQMDSAWRSSIPKEHNAGQSGKVMIRCKVLPNGHVTDLVLEKRSGNTAIDRAAWSALAGSVFPPLPSSLHDPYLELRRIFANPDSAQGLSPAGPPPPPPDSASAQNPDSGAPQRIHISAGVAQGLLIQKTDPVYPPIAKVAASPGWWCWWQPFPKPARLKISA